MKSNGSVDDNHLNTVKAGTSYTCVSSTSLGESLHVANKKLL